MRRTWQALWRWLLDTRPARQTFEVILRALSRRRLARLDRQDAARAQNSLLLGYLHQARKTRFGREHDFARLRTPDDFRRLVPLSTADELARSWWLPAWPDLAGSSWPDLRPATVDPTATPLAVRSAALTAARRSALRTAVAFVVHARPQAPLCAGRFLLLDGGPFDCSAMPPLLRPLARTAPPGSLDIDPTRPIDGPVTCLTGPADRLIGLAEQVRRHSGAARLADAWPTLAAVLWDGPSGAESSLRESLGAAPLLLQTVRLLGQPVAVTDPRHGLPRLLTSSAGYFEFVPEDEIGKERPARLALGGVRPGGRYELVLTTPGGLWACRTGQLVEVGNREAALVRFLGATPTPAPRAAHFRPAAAGSSCPSTKRRHSGRAARNARPYPLVNTRGSRMTTMPWSVAVRLSCLFLNKVVTDTKPLEARYEWPPGMTERWARRQSARFGKIGLSCLKRI